MGCFDVYCFICGGPIYNGVYINEIKDSFYNWLNELIVLTSNDNFIEAKGSNYDSYGRIKENDIIYNINYTNWRFYIKNNNGFTCHKKCHKLIQTKLNHNIVYTNLTNYAQICEKKI